jgi:hypothetical protein
MSRLMGGIPAVILLLVVVPAVCEAGAVAVATGTEVLAEMLNPGQLTCVGGVPTGTPFPPLCSPETTQVQLRGRVSKATYVNLAGSGAWMFDGTNTILANCDLSPAMAGHCWGTFSWAIEGAGTWEGTWDGDLDMMGGPGGYSATARGSGALLAGNALTYQAVTPLMTFMATVSLAGSDCHLIAGVAHNPGVSGTAWRSDVAAVNLGQAAATVDMTLRTSSGALTASTSVPAGGTANWRNVLETVFGVAADADIQGALEVDSDQPLAVTARTYNSTPDGTYGQSLPALTRADALRPGGIGTLPMLSSGADFRTNVGALNLGDGPATVFVRLFGPGGAQVGHDVTFDIPANEWRQVGDLLAVAGAGEQATAFATVTMTAGDAVWVYASLIDNRTGDPSTIEMLTR